MRPVLVAIAGFFFVLVGLVTWIALIYLNRPADLLICQGENEEGCSYHTDFVSCAGSLQAVAEKICRRYEILPAAEFESKGGKCDYRTTRVICKR